MAYEVVARRWRPLRFADVVGQEHVTRTLKNAIERDRVPHAFLFTGIRGVGKTTVARLLARALNCPQRHGAEPCNSCPSCQQMLSGAAVDVVEIDGASNRGIDEVRALIEAAQYRPAGGRYRVYIIDEVHQVTSAAFNALLKILEEPPAHVKFVLATTDPQKVPATVLSRCQRYDFRRLSVAEIRSHLERIVDHDGLAVDSKALELIAREAGGSMRDAQSLLEQVVAMAGGEAVGADSVNELLGIAGEALVFECTGAVLERRPEAVVETVARLRRDGLDPERFLAAVLEQLRHVAVAAAAGPEALGDGCTEAAAEAAAKMKDRRSVLDIQRIFDSLLGTLEAMRRSPQPDLVLEMGLLKAAAFEEVATAGEILARLDQIERGQWPGGAPVSQPPGGPGAGAGKEGLAASGRKKRAESRAQEAAGSSGHSGGELTGSDSGSNPAGQWEGFLEFLQQRGELDLYLVLVNCRICLEGPDRWSVRPLVDTFRTVIDNDQALGRLKNLAAEWCGRPIEIVVERGKAAGGGISVHEIERDRQRRIEQAALSDPVVQAALRVLGGKVERIARLEE